jgi:excisionase family DNA binding protein
MIPESDVPSRVDALEHLRHSLTLTVPEAAVLLCISRGTAYAAARAGQLPTLRLGRRLVVPVQAFHQMLELQSNGAVGSPDSLAESGDTYV